MSWTYLGDPSASQTAQVRFLIGDTDTTDQQLQDAEIAWLLTQSPNTYRAAAAACDGLSAKYARKADIGSGPFKGSFSQRAKAYATLATRLRKTAARRGASVYVGGISRSDKTNHESDADRVSPYFSRDGDGFEGMLLDVEDQAEDLDGG